MEPAELIKAQRKQIEELQKQLLEKGTIQDLTESFKPIIDGQVKEYQKVAEQLQNFAKQLQTYADTIKK